MRPDLDPHHPINLSAQKITQYPPNPLFLHPIQAKMMLGGANDKYEQEADRIAKQVVRRLHQPTQPPSPEDEAANIQPQGITEADESLQRTPIVQSCSDSSVGAMRPEQETNISAVIQRGGKPLPDTIRQSMEQGFGSEDFSHVRLHDDVSSQAVAASIGAKAFTLGHHIVGSVPNPEVMAHELQHVRQQSRETLTHMPSSSLSLLPVSHLGQPKIQRMLMQDGRVLTYEEIMVKLQELQFSTAQINYIMGYASQPVLYDFDQVRISATLRFPATPIQQPVLPPYCPA